MENFNLFFEKDNPLNVSYVALPRSIFSVCFQKQVAVKTCSKEVVLTARCWYCRNGFLTRAPGDIPLPWE
ncbi:MAG: hypothetical protein D3925_05655 [Candidatus Electrothrix sp. AR5]|nr:hypothetical protein [Candidatus Electrothrix sp. AR5]